MADPILEFIGRCDAYCRASGRSRVWLSKRLFQDTDRLAALAGGRSDVGVMRLARAEADLDLLVNPDNGTSSDVDAGTMAPTAELGAPKVPVEIGAGS